MQTTLTIDPIEQLAQSIIEDVRKDARQTRDGEWQAYEYHKKRIERLYLPADAFEQAIRNLTTALNI